MTSAEGDTEPAEAPCPVLPLAGYTIAVTAARRREELESLLERRGARVVSAPAIRIVPLADDTELLAATRNLIDTPPDVVVATTGIGFRGWTEAADGWGLAEDLREALAGARLMARGPKAKGAIRAAGFTEEWSPASESSTEVLEHLLAQGVRGLRVAIQLHGEPLPDFVDGLDAAGAEVIQVPVYRWVLPEDIAPIRKLVELIANRQVDAVTFTSAPAAASLLQVAKDEGAYERMVQALRTDVLCVCVGSITAAPLERVGATCVQPERARLGALVREVVEQVPLHRGLSVSSRGSALDVRGHAAVRNGTLLPLAPAPMAVLRTLARQPGRVVPRSELAAVLAPDAAIGSRDEHALEMAVTRLRSALGASGLVETVVKRGYRLAAPD